MSRAAQKLISASGGKAYEIDQSLMFEVADSSYLSKTPSSASNQRTWTLSTWIKNTSENYAGGSIWTSWDSSTQSDASYGWLGLYQDKLHIGGWSTSWRITNRLFRDVGAWMHLVVAVDTTIADGSADNRIKIYINGIEETSFATKNNPSQNYDLPWNSTQQHRLGAINGSTAYYFGGYFAETQVIDGSQLTPSSFGETDSETNAWIPKKYTGSHGTNGFYMPFAKNDRYSVYFDGSTSTGIQTADSSDFTLGTNNFTIEAWVRRNDDYQETGYIAAQSDSSGADANSAFTFFIDANQKPRMYIFYSGGNLDLISSTAIAENTWNHVAFVRNGTGFVLYLNGTSVATATSSASVTDSGYKLGVGVLGEYVSAGQFKGWISNFRFVNGSAVYTSNFTPSTSPLTAVTNTKLLCCQDSTITTDNSGTSKTITVINTANTYSQQIAPFDFDWWQDQSGQSNDYQPYNVNLNDVMLDSPTNNFCTYNSLDNGSTVLSQGNLKFVNSSGNSDTGCTMQIPFTGKWYWEIRATAVDAMYYGITRTSYTGTDGSYGSDGRTILYNGTFWNGSSAASYGSSYSDGDIVNVAFDCDNSKLYFGKNGTWFNSGNPATGSNPAGSVTASEAWVPNMYGNSGTQNDINFGQNGTFNGLVKAQGNADGGGIGNFYYSVPSGYKALCSKNLPSATIKKPTEHFNTILYTGDDTDDRTLTGVGFQPDWVWIKTRDTTNYHQVFDSVRGISRDLHTNNNDAETVASDPNNSLVAFTSDGFTVDDSAGYSDLNSSSHNYVAWNWKAGGSGSSNTDGAQTTIVSANTTAGFSIVTFTGTGSATTFGHGLGAVPKAYIMKRRDSANYWWIGTTTIDGSHDFGELDTAKAFGASSLTAPTSSVFYSDGSQNTSSATYVAYVFAEVSGFSKFGRYEGNGSSDGPFINTGFKPAWVMIHTTAGGTSWIMLDNKRDPHNAAGHYVLPDLANAEADFDRIDFLSNGFKLRQSYTGDNSNGVVYFYMAFAESPFKYANAR